MRERADEGNAVLWADYRTLLTWAGLLWACGVPRTNRRMSRGSKSDKADSRWADAIMAMSEASAQNGPWSRLDLADNGVHPGNSGRWPSRSDGSRLVWRKSNHEVQTVLTVSASAQSYGRWPVVVGELRRVACVCGPQGTFLRRTGPRERKVGFQLSYIDPTRTLLGLPFAIESALLLW